MFFLIATILLNTVLFTLFKVFPKYGIDNLQAIVVNYIVCVITGSLFLGHIPIGRGSLDQPWFPWAMMMGIGFIAIFNLIAWRTGKEGMTVTTITNKLSMVIPVLASFYLYGDKASMGKVAGILLAGPAVFLATRTNKTEDRGTKNYFWIAVLFAGSGLLDTIVKYAEHSFLKDDIAQNAYTIHVFAAAAVSGMVMIPLSRTRTSGTLSWRNVAAGIILGVPNYFSLYCLIRMLNSGFLQSSAAIPVNNIGIVLISSILAMLAFKEPANKWRMLGLLLSVVAILLIAFSDIYG